MVFFAAQGAWAQKPLRETVTIAVDAEAARALQTLEDRWGNGRWKDLVETLVELCETRGTHVVNFEPGEIGKTARYGLVQTACDRLIASLPPEGLAIYRRRIDPTAERWFRDWQKTGNSALLERIVRQAYFSSWGDDALWEMGQLAWERGDFSSARQLWSQLLPERDADDRYYPDAEQPAAEVAARCILCLIFSHEDDLARSALRNFNGRYATAVGTLGGQHGRWSELLSSAMMDSRSWPRPATGQAVPTFGGNSARTLISPNTIDIGAELWSVPISPIRLPDVPRVTLFPPPLPLAYHPAVVDGRVFLNEGRRILAWDLATGRPAWDASAMIYPAIADDLPQMPARAVSGGPSWTVSIADGRLFARMGSAVTTPSPHELRDLPNEIVCLDIGEGQGRLVWKRTGEELAAALHEPAETPNWNWEGSPLVHSGRVYAALSRRRPQLEWSIACLDAETGLLLWHRSVGISRPTPPEHENRASQLLLTLGDGRLFLSTDWGAIVAVDAAEGRLQWAVTYESQPVVFPPAMPMWRNAPSPPVYADGRLYVAPADVSRVFCFDADTGRQIWQAETGERLTSAIGVSKGRFIAAGKSLWAFDTETGARAWHISQTEPEDYGYGRGWLAGSVVYWSSRQALYAFDVQNGQSVRERPLGAVDPLRTGGNLVVAEGVLLIAAGDRLTAYGQFTRQRASQNDFLSQRAKPRVSFVSTSPPVFAKPNEEPDPPADSISSAYLRRLWQRALAPDARVIMPRGNSLPLLLHLRNGIEAWDAATGNVLWELPLDDELKWAAVESDRLLLGTPTEFAAIHSETGVAVWRAAWRSTLNATQHASTPVQFHQLGNGIVAIDPRTGFVWYDSRTGRVLFIHRFFDALPPLEFTADTHSLAVWSRRWGRLERWDFAAGRPTRTVGTISLRWITTPQSQPNGWVLVTEDRRLVWTSPRLQPEREYVTVANATAEPWMVAHDVALLDGFVLVGLHFDDERVRTRWSQPLSRGALTQPPVQCAVLDGRIYAAAGGLLRGTDLQTGSTAWDQSLGLTDPVQVVGWKDSSGSVIAAVPFGEPRTPISGIMIYDAATGHQREWIALSPARQVHLRPHPVGLVIITDAEVVALAGQ